jgi:hypothetical protein
VVAATAGVLLTAGCNIRHELLHPQQPGLIGLESVENPTAADAMRKGVVGDLKLISSGSGSTNSETIWLLGGLLTDEWENVDPTAARVEIDQRQPQNTNALIQNQYGILHRLRGRARDALVALNAYLPEPRANFGQMHFAEGFAVLTLGENFCNGIPLGSNDNGVPVYTQPLTTDDVFAAAIAKLDTALTYVTAADTFTVRVRNAILLAKARAQLDLGQFAAAAATVTPVPTSYSWFITTSAAIANDDNSIWTFNTQQRRYSVGDSVETTGRVLNAIPFARLADPRLPVTGSPTTCTTLTGLDGTCRVDQTVFSQDAGTPLVSGVDARLIEAEARLNAGDVAGMMTILNALRASPQVLAANRQSPVMTPLATPATTAAATDLFFRERAIWTFGRGQRLPSLRRLVRQYGRDAATVYPTGSYVKGGTYGTATQFTVPANESNNPFFTGCLDAKP